MVRFDDRFENALDYSDVFIVPQYSNIKTRTQVDTSVKLGNLSFDVPLLSANMDTISGEEMCVAMWKAGARGAMHRFMSVDENVKQFSSVYNTSSRFIGEEDKGYNDNLSNCFVSIGVNRDSKARTEVLYNAGARHFILDIAHGHSLNAKTMILWVKKSFPDIHLMVGNVANPDAVKELEDWGADSVKVGIGPGGFCLTKNVTGVTVPQLTAVMKCAEVANVPIVGDGGIKEIGDVAKCLAAGADVVMVASMLAATDECPGEVIEGSNGRFKVARGMASREAMKVVRVDENLPTPEGKSMWVPVKGKVENIINDIAGGLRSSFSYVGAKTLKEFQLKATFGTRRTVK